MFYNLVKTPVIVKTGKHILGNMDRLLSEAHLVFPKKILITQENLYEAYKEELGTDTFYKVILVEGGQLSETNAIIDECKSEDVLMIAFGGGSVLDIVKYSASKMDKPYITVPSALSNDAIYSCVARLTENRKKISLGVQPPIGILVDIDVIKKSPRVLFMAGVADLVSNLSAIQDWLLAHNEIGEPINELAFMLAKESALPMLRYSEDDVFSDNMILDLVNGLVTSGLGMIISCNTRGTSGAEHLISHAIDEYFPNKSTIHGIQVGWAQTLIAKKYHNDPYKVNEFYKNVGLMKIFNEMIPWSEEEFENLIPYAKKIRNRYTIFDHL